MGGVKGRKQAKRLLARVKEYEAHGKNPPQPNNPSNGTGTGHDMHRPGGKR